MMHPPLDMSCRGRDGPAAPEYQVQTALPTQASDEDGGRDGAAADDRRVRQRVNSTTPTTSAANASRPPITNSNSSTRRLTIATPTSKKRASSSRTVQSLMASPLLEPGPRNDGGRRTLTGPGHPSETVTARP